MTDILIVALDILFEYVLYPNRGIDATKAIDTLRTGIAELQSRAEAAEAKLAACQQDAAIGAVVWRFIDRMNDVAPSDPAERILADFVAAVSPLIDAALRARGWRDDALTLADVNGALAEIAENFDGGEYTVDDAARALLLDFVHGLAEHPLFAIVGAYYTQQAALAQPKPDETCLCPIHGEWIAAADVRRLTRELDVAINGEEGAARQASLCDIVAQVKRDGLIVRASGKLPAGVVSIHTTDIPPGYFIIAEYALREIIGDKELAKLIAACGFPVTDNEQPAVPDWEPDGSDAPIRDAAQPQYMTAPLDSYALAAITLNKDERCGYWFGWNDALSAALTQPKPESAMTPTPEGLPELPVPYFHCCHVTKDEYAYTAQQMRDYALAASQQANAALRSLIEYVLVDDPNLLPRASSSTRAYIRTELAAIAAQEDKL